MYLFYFKYFYAIFDRSMTPLMFLVANITSCRSFSVTVLGLAGLKRSLALPTSSNLLHHHHYMFESNKLLILLKFEIRPGCTWFFIAWFFHTRSKILAMVLWQDYLLSPLLRRFSFVCWPQRCATQRPFRPSLRDFTLLGCCNYWIKSFVAVCYNQ